MSYLKSAYLDLVCQSAMPPYVSELDFVNFYRKSQMPDENLKAASIDLVFV